MGMERTAWPESKVVRPLVAILFLVILSVLTALCTLRLAAIGTFRRFWQISFARKLILCTLLDSYLFTACSALLLFGIGSSLSQGACLVGILNCILLYASSKIMIYMFLMERLAITHSCVPAQGASFKDRFKSWWYRVAFVLLLGWGAVAALMLAGRNAELSENGQCRIGLKLIATIPMLTLDVLVNCFLTAGFIWPVMKAGFKEASQLTKTSLLAAGLALITSFVNILILAIMKGHQQSFVCLSSCVFDVAANACILFIITRHPARGEGISRQNAERGVDEGVRPDISRRTSMAQIGAARPTLANTHKRHSSTLVESIHYLPTFPAFNESVESLRLSPPSSRQIGPDTREHTGTFIIGLSGRESQALPKPAKAVIYEGIQISRITQLSVDGPDGPGDAEQTKDEPAVPL